MCGGGGGGVANNKGNNKEADQPAHMPSLISAFVIRLLESIISRLASSEISFYWLVSVAEETGLSLVLLETLKTGFLVASQMFQATTFYNSNC